MKIALLQCNMVTGDVMGNAQRILHAAQKAAAAGASLCVTPELALCGVAPRALLFSEGFLPGCRTALYDMAKRLEGGPAVLVGAPVANAVFGGRQMTNAAVLLHNGTCNVVARKVFHGQTGESDELRYFERGVSCGLITLAGWRLGVVICEDGTNGESFWKIQYANAHNPLMELVSRGVDGIVHMASAPYSMDRQTGREHILSHVAARHHVHVFSANMVGGNDSTVYPGQSLAFGPTGLLLARGRVFEEDLLVVDTATGGESSAKASPSVEEECWGALVLGTRDYVRKSGASKALLGISGGMDSALVAAIAVDALGKENVRGLVLPSPYTSAESLQYAVALAANLGIKTDTVPIEPLMQAFEKTLEPLFAPWPQLQGDVTAENIQARIRGMLLMALSNRSGAMVLNTGNKSEAAMGYSTLYGDAVGALSVIGDVSKTMVYALARWYNARHPGKGIPEGILTRPPTAELRPDQLDSDSLPPYEVLDPMLEELMRCEPLPEDRDSRGDKALRQAVYRGMRRAEFKRRQAPLALRVTGLAFGSDWNIPVVADLNFLGSTE